MNQQQVGARASVGPNRVDATLKVLGDVFGENLRYMSHPSEVCLQFEHLLCDGITDR